MSPPYPTTDARARPPNPSDAAATSPHARAPPARQRAMPPLPRRRVPDPASAGLRGASRTARVPVRPRPRAHRGGCRPPLAGSGRAHAPALAAARRARVLRALLLRVGDTVLPRPEPGRARRSTRDGRRAAAVLVVASRGAPSPRARARRHGRARARAAPARRPPAGGCRREELSAGRHDRRAAPTPLGRERMAQRRAEPRTPRQGPHARAPRAGADGRRIGSPAMSTGAPHTPAAS